MLKIQLAYQNLKLRSEMSTPAAKAHGSYRTTRLSGREGEPINVQIINTPRGT